MGFRIENWPSFLAGFALAVAFGYSFTWISAIIGLCSSKMPNRRRWRVSSGFSHLTFASSIFRADPHNARLVAHLRRKSAGQRHRRHCARPHDRHRQYGRDHHITHLDHRDFPCCHAAGSPSVRQGGIALTFFPNPKRHNHLTNCWACPLFADWRLPAVCLLSKLEKRHMIRPNNRRFIPRDLRAPPCGRGDLGVRGHTRDHISTSPPRLMLHWLYVRLLPSFSLPPPPYAKIAPICIPPPHLRQNRPNIHTVQINLAPYADFMLSMRPSMGTLWSS